MSFLPQDDNAERGSVATEYALLAGLIAVVIVGGVQTFGTAVVNLFASIPPSL